MLAIIVEDLRAGSAGAIVPHGPEIILCGDTDDAAFRQAGDLLPEIEGLVVCMEDRCRQAIGRKAELPRDERPG
jgi:hypothetical protein